MPIITFKYEGKIYQRRVEKYENSVYIMHSRGLQYWFRKDSHIATNNGWHLVYGGSLPEFMIALLSEELERLQQDRV